MSHVIFHIAENTDSNSNIYVIRHLPHSRECRFEFEHAAEGDRTRVRCVSVRVCLYVYTRVCVRGCVYMSVCGMCLRERVRERERVCLSE